MLAEVTAEQVVALRTQGYEVEIQEAPATIEVRGRPVAMAASDEKARSAEHGQPETVSTVPAGPPPNALGPGIHSWGGGDFGEYDSYAEFVDRFMWEHKGFLILFAAGNDGVDADHNGVIDTGSVTPPGTAKNCLTVGAAESVRSQGGYQAAYGQLWPSDYAALPLRGDKVSDNGDDVAAF